LGRFTHFCLACSVVAGYFVDDFLTIEEECLEAQSGMKILVSWAPFLVLIAFWIGFMIYMRKSTVMVSRREWFNQTLEHQKRIEGQLERIATKLEQDSRK